MKKLVLLLLFVSLSISYASDKSKIFPAELISFRIEEEFNYNLAVWETASEVNTKEFILQSKIQGENEWTDLGSVEAAGISNTKKEYSFDEIPLVPFEYMLYRLKIVDLDSEESLSIERTIYFDDITRITTFDGYSAQEGMIIEWQTEFERQLRGFLLRRTAGDVNSTIASVTAKTFSSTPENYRITDSQVISGGDYRYYLYGIPVGKDTTVLLGTIHQGYNPSSVNGNDLESEIDVYPNPASEIICIDLKNSDLFIDNITLIDLSGRTILTGVMINDGNRLNISNLTAGAYLLKIKLTYGMILRKMIFKN